MVRRALLIGSQTFGLTGVHHDVAAMSEVLQALNFQVQTCVETATRSAIFSALGQLTEEVSGEDAVLVYFAGHGSRAANTQWQPQNGESRFAPFFVPCDMAESGPGDFRGILNVEWAAMLRQLTAKCPNTVQILDCCHAASLVRSARGRPRSVLSQWDVLAVEHYRQWLDAHREEPVNLGPDPNLVSLTAAGSSQSAFEDPCGEFGGYFTEVVVEALGQAGQAPVSWADVGAWAREQVLVMEPRQRPEIHGPAQRLVFQMPSPARSRLEPESSAGKLVFFWDGVAADRPSLRGGHLHGVAVGNRYALEGWDESTLAARRVATAEVTHVCGGVSRVRLSGGDPRDGTLARPLRQVCPRRQIAVAGDAALPLRKAIATSPLLELAGGDCRTSLASVRKVSNGWDILDETGTPSIYAVSDVRDLVDHLEVMARAQTLRELNELEGYRLEDPFELTWGRVDEHGQLQEAGIEGAPLYQGDRVFLRIVNFGERDLFLNAYDIGLSRRVTLLHPNSRSGYLLHPGDSWCFGHHPLRGLRGMPLRWPRGVPTKVPKLETLVVIVSDQPVDLTVLETGGAGVRSKRAVNVLEQKVARLCLGHCRDADGDPASDVRFAVRQIHFELFPSLRQED